jgi:Zn ribbon nucleic-acid-binding protein
MKEISFIVEKSFKGGFIAKAIGESIFYRSQTMEDLQINVKEAVECHFEDHSIPDSIRFSVLQDPSLYPFFPACRQAGLLNS